MEECGGQPVDDGDEPEQAPSSLPPDHFARNQENAVGNHEFYMWLRSGGFTMVEGMIYLAARDILSTMIALQEAVVAAQHETPEAPEQD